MKTGLRNPLALLLRVHVTRSPTWTGIFLGPPWWPVLSPGPGHGSSLSRAIVQTLYQSCHLSVLPTKEAPFKSTACIALRRSASPSRPSLPRGSAGSAQKGPGRKAAGPLNKPRLHGPSQRSTVPGSSAPAGSNPKLKCCRMTSFEL